MKITFTSEPIYLDMPWQPAPATKFVPDWFKRMKSYHEGDMNGIGVRPENDQDQSTSTHFTGTVKRCIPFLDAMTQGYIIPTFFDIMISKEHDRVTLVQTNPDIGVTQHQKHQIENFPTMGYSVAYKYPNVWAIKTPKGYSTMFVPPMNNPNPIITPFSGTVDTDTYENFINFPFFVNPDLPIGQHVVPAGTPLIQLIPFKRDNFKMESVEMDARQKERYHSLNMSILSVFKNAYRSRFWQKKSYK